MKGKKHSEAKELLGSHELWEGTRRDKCRVIRCCPANDNGEYSGANRGLFRGRFCWAVAGTLCENNFPGSFVKDSGIMKNPTLTVITEEERDVIKNIFTTKYCMFSFALHSQCWKITFNVISDLACISGK